MKLEYKPKIKNNGIIIKKKEALMGKCKNFIIGYDVLAPDI